LASNFFGKLPGVGTTWRSVFQPGLAMSGLNDIPLLRVRTTALGKDLKAAQTAAYAAAGKTHFDSPHFHRDIAAKAMK
jgi:hypothetical protein